MRWMEGDEGKSTVLPGGERWMEGVMRVNPLSSQLVRSEWRV
jgi:hypothetical protein